MAEIILDLTGSGGLADMSAGDIDLLAGTPSYRYKAKETELVSGFFNPYYRDGYLSPAITATTSLTYDVTPTKIFGSAVHDTLQDVVYFAERGEKIYRTDSLPDTSMVTAIQVDTGSVINDIEIYELNKNRNLWYSYLTNKVYMESNASNESSFTSLGFVIQPSSTTAPEILASDDLISNAATISTDLVVPSKSNMVGIVVMQMYTGGGETVSSITFGGAAMTLAYSYTCNVNQGQVTTFVYYKTGVTSGTKTVSVTRSTTTSTRAVAFVTDNTNQTTPTANHVHLENAGTRIPIWIDSVANGTPVQFSVASKYNFTVSGTTAAASYNPAAQTGGNGAALFFKPDGTKMYVGANTAIFQYSLSTAFNPSTATYDTKTYDTVGQIASLQSIFISSDGTKMMAAQLSGATVGIYRYTLGTAWDISTASYVNSFVMNSAPNDWNTIAAMVWSSDGKTAYIAGIRDNEPLSSRIEQYTLTTGWDLTTISTTGKFYYDGNLHDGLALTNNNSELWFHGQSSGDPIQKLRFHQYFPLDIEKATLLTDSATKPSSQDLRYIPDYGTLFLARSGSNDDVYSNNLVSGATPTMTLTNTKIQLENRTSSFVFGVHYNRSPKYMLEVGNSSLPDGYATNKTWLTGTQNTFISSDSDYNFFRLADNGFMYLFSKNSVHKIDGGFTGGQNGVITENVLLFPEYFTIVDAVDYRSLLYIPVHQEPITVSTATTKLYSGKCGIFVWDRRSIQLGGTDYIELPGVKEIKKIYVSPDQVLKLIVINDSGLTELREYGYNDSGGVVFRPFKTLSIGAFPQFPDGLTVAGDKSVWIANDGTIYSEKDKSVVKLFEVKTLGTTVSTILDNIQSGSMVFLSDTETSASEYRTNKQAFTFSYKDGSNFYTKRIYPLDRNTGSNGLQPQHQGDVFSKVVYIPVTSVVRNIRIYNLPTTSGPGTTGCATVNIYFNQHTTADMTKTIQLSESGRGYVDFHINKPYIHAVQIEVEWNSGLSLGAATYHPSFAVITHDAATTKSPDNG